MSFHLKYEIGMLALGVSCNRLAMWANGGKMPVRVQLWRGGITNDKQHCHMTDETRLKWLCDIHRYPMQNKKVVIMSIGDIIIYTGVLYFIISVSWMIFP